MGLISSAAPTATALLIAWGRGESAAFDRLVTLVQRDLRGERHDL